MILLYFLINNFCIYAVLSQLCPLRSFAAASFSKVTPKVVIGSGRLSRRCYEELVLKRTGAVTTWVPYQ